MSEPERILLVGMMGAGKTTVGRLLAQRLAWPYLDSDEEVERRTGHTVPEIWKAEGEAAFRRWESQVLADACATSPAVVSVAGGAVLDESNRRLIAGSGMTVWLRAAVPTLSARVGAGAGRPLLEAGPAEALARLSAERAPLYEALADLVFDVDHMRPPEVAEAIASAWAERTADR